MMSEAPLNWIVVEDNPDSRFLFERFIRKVAGEEVNVVSLSSAEDCRAYAKLSDEPADALILDLMLPDGTGPKPVSLDAFSQTVEEIT